VLSPKLESLKASDFFFIPGIAVLSSRTKNRVEVLLDSSRMSSERRYNGSGGGLPSL
jgi:hypothetical protein